MPIMAKMMFMILTEITLSLIIIWQFGELLKDKETN